MNRISHRAAVEAGYASLDEYIEKWKNHPDELIYRLRKKPPTYGDAIAAADKIEKLLREQIEKEFILNELRRMNQENNDWGHSLLKNIERLREALIETLAVARRNELGDYLQRAEVAIQQSENES